MFKSLKLDGVGPDVELKRVKHEVANQKYQGVQAAQQACSDRMCELQSLLCDLPLATKSTENSFRYMNWALLPYSIFFHRQWTFRC